MLQRTLYSGPPRKCVCTHTTPSCGGWTTANRTAWKHAMGRLYEEYTRQQKLNAGTAAVLDDCCSKGYCMLWLEGALAKLRGQTYTKWARFVSRAAKQLAKQHCEVKLNPRFIWQATPGDGESQCSDVGGNLPRKGVTSSQGNPGNLRTPLLLLQLFKVHPSSSCCCLYQGPEPCWSFKPTVIEQQIFKTRTIKWATLLTVV